MNLYDECKNFHGCTAVTFWFLSPLDVLPMCCRGSHQVLLEFHDEVPRLVVAESFKSRVVLAKMTSYFSSFFSWLPNTI